MMTFRNAKAPQISVLLATTFASWGCNSVMGWNDREVVEWDQYSELEDEGLGGANAAGDDGAGQGSGSGEVPDGLAVGGRDSSGGGGGGTFTPPEDPGGSTGGSGSSFAFPPTIESHVDFDVYGGFSFDNGLLSTDTFEGNLFVAGFGRAIVDPPPAASTAPYCMSGSLPAVSADVSYGIMAIDLTSAGGTLTPTMAGLVVDVSDFGDADLMLAISSQGEDWCALLEDGGSFIAWTDLLADCLALNPSSGSFDGGSTIDGLAVVTRSTFVEVDFAMCLHGMIEADAL